MIKSQFSKLISGTMSWGAWGKNFNFSEMQQLFENTVDLGITSFDHADIYGGYSLESVFGDAFFRADISRSAVQFITKCGIQMTGSDRPNTVKHYDCSKAYIISSAEASLKHLKTEYLDALLIHRPSPLMDPYEVMEAVQQLKKEGKIINFGVSNFTPSQVNLLTKEVAVEINQIEFSAVQHQALFDGSLDQMFTHQITPMAWAPLGRIFSTETTSQKKRILEVLEELSTTYNASPDTLLLAWVLKHPSGVHPVIGTTNLKRIEASLGAASIALRTEDWFRILEASQGHKVP